MKNPSGCRDSGVGAPVKATCRITADSKLGLRGSGPLELLYTVPTESGSARGDKQAQLGKPTPKVSPAPPPSAPPRTAVHPALTSSSRSPRRPETESKPWEPPARPAAAVCSPCPHAPSSSQDSLLFHALEVREERRQGANSSRFSREWWSVASLFSPPPLPTAAEQGYQMGSGSRRASPSSPAAPPAVPAERPAAPAPLPVPDYGAELGDRIANEPRGLLCSAPRSDSQ